MEERKNIAMCICGSTDGVHDEIIRGAFEYCQSRNIRLLLYNGMLSDEEYRPEEEASLVFGESMPFQMVPFDEISGLIIGGSTLKSNDAINALVSQTRKRDLPVVSIEDDLTTGCFHVNVNDEEGMESMVRHIVEEHGFTTVNFIAGIPGNRESDNRLNAYKRVLEENGIAIDERRIGYGMFGKETFKVMEGFFDGTMEKPQAIICSNDQMAIYAIEFLFERGYRVPEDIVVTGYDGEGDAINFCPSITTVRRGMRELGEQAARVITRVWKGKTVSLDSHVVPGIVYNQSCGCVPRADKQLIKMYDYQHEQVQKMKYESYMEESLLHFAGKADTIESYIETMEYSVKDFNIAKMFFCMADEPFRHVPGEGEKFAHYPEKMKIAGAYNVAGYRSKHINTGEIPPELLTDDIVCVSFLPIYYNERTFGYLMMGHTDMDFDRSYFKRWLGVVSAQMAFILKSKAE